MVLRGRESVREMPQDVVLTLYRSIRIGGRLAKVVFKKNVLFACLEVEFDSPYFREDQFPVIKYFMTRHSPQRWLEVLLCPIKRFGY